MSDLLGLASSLVSLLPDWFEYPFVLLFGAWAIWWGARNLASVFGLLIAGCVAWVGISSAQAYADHGDPYLALLSGVNGLLEQIQQIWK